MGVFKTVGYICDKCGFKWVPRVIGRVPVICPTCKSKKWNS